MPFKLKHNRPLRAHKPPLPHLRHSRSKRMENQPLFNLIITVSGAIGGWMLKVIWDAIRDLKNDISNLNKEMHQDFVRRDDFGDAVKRIEYMCERIFDKLDNKMDK